MKKTIISGFIISIIGAILLAIGLGLKGNKSIVFEDLKPVIADSTKVTQAHTYKDINKLDIDVKDVNVEFREGKNYSVRYEGAKSSSPTVKKSGNQLQIKGRLSSHSIRFNGMSMYDDYYRNSDRNKMIITLPKDSKLDELNLKLSDSLLSQINMTGIEADQVKASIHDTKLDLRDANFGNVELSAGDSDISMTNTVLSNGKLDLNDTDVRLDGGSLMQVAMNITDGDVDYNNLSIQGGNLRNNDGDIKMSNTQIQGGYKIDDTDGDILVSRVTVDGYRVQSNDGDVRLFEQTTSNGNVLEKNSNSDNVLDIISNDGDITVN